jgi:hypothetical protein
MMMEETALHGFADGAASQLEMFASAALCSCLIIHSECQQLSAAPCGSKMLIFPNSLPVKSETVNYMPCLILFMVHCSFSWKSGLPTSAL